MGDSAVAYRYAEALYELAREQGRAASVLENLASLKASLDADPAAWGTLSDPRKSVAEKEAMLVERFGATGEPLLGNTLRLMLRRRRMEALRAFFRAYLDVHERGEGILRVEVETASPLDAGELSGLQSRLEGALSKTVILEPRVDPDLLGGVRFVADSRVVDGSLRNRLEVLKKELRGVSVS